eukprot:PRCOL_00005428-RA
MRKSASKPTRRASQSRIHSSCAAGVSNTSEPGYTRCWSWRPSHGTTSVTCVPPLARKAARSSGFTAVPVIQGSDAVVTMATLLLARSAGGAGLRRASLRAA